MATRALLQELAPLWHAQGGEPLLIESVGGVDAAKRVASGDESWDVALLASDAIDRLCDGAHVQRQTKADWASSEMAVAVRAGESQPDLSSEAALRESVLAAASKGMVGYSTGPSGAALLALLERWGIVDVLKPSLLQATPGVPVGTLVAEGRAVLGFQQCSELIHMSGITALYPLPGRARSVTVFSAAVVSSSQQRQQAQQFIAFLQSPQTDAIKRAHGMQPV